jgi:hypothetical protein
VKDDEAVERRHQETRIGFGIRAADESDESREGVPKGFALAEAVFGLQCVPVERILAHEPVQVRMFERKVQVAHGQGLGRATVGDAVGQDRKKTLPPGAIDLDQHSVE